MTIPLFFFFSYASDKKILDIWTDDRVDRRMETIFHNRAIVPVLQTITGTLRQCATLIRWTPPPTFGDTLIVDILS